MIIRVFRARLKPGKRPAFERLCQSFSIPLMREQPGMLAISIAAPAPRRLDEFILVSVWRDLESLRAFAGPNWREATILPGEADLLEAAGVEHYNESYSSLIELWTATSETIKRREATALATELTDAQWAAIAPLLPAPARTGRPRANDRQTLEGILYVLRNSCRWHDLPSRYGDPVTCWRRYVQWERSGVWERIWEALLVTLEPVARQAWALAFLDTRFIPPTKRGRKYPRPSAELDTAG
ncbi:MAG TPA: transposase [Ktedonobacterales bacterium]